MSRAQSWRRAGLAALLAGVLYAAWTAPPAADPVVGPVERGARPVRPADSSDPAAQLAQVASGTPAAPAGSPPHAPDDEAPWRQPFAVPAWAQPHESHASEVPPTPAAKVAVQEVVAPSAAPPLPFKALGRYEDERGPVALLLHFDQSLIARPGDKVADVYQLEAIRDQTAVFTHLPTQTRQTLEISSPP